MDREKIYYRTKNGLLAWFYPDTSVKSVKKEFMNKCTPGKGKITYAPGYNKESHKEEEEVAKWLFKEFGGHIHLVNENKGTSGISNPDYIWKGKWWELKGVTTKTSINNRLRDAIKQINNNQEYRAGGVIIDVSKSNDDKNDVITIVKRRLGDSSKGKTFVIIKDKDKVIDIIRAQNKK